MDSNSQHSRSSDTHTHQGQTKHKAVRRNERSQHNAKKHCVVRAQDDINMANRHFRGDCDPSSKGKGGNSSPSLSLSPSFLHIVRRKGNSPLRRTRSYQPLSEDPPAALGGRPVKQGQPARGSVHTSRECRFGDGCWYQHLFCPFRHPKTINLSRPAPVAVQPARVGNVSLHPGMSSAPVPSAGPFRANRFEEDDRVLPVPEPHDKHDPPVSRARRYQDAWSWGSWKGWLRQCWDRQWSKRPIRDALRKRSQVAQGIDWSHASDQFDEKGLIYMLYHFPSGRRYVGQTINTLWLRGQQHWWERDRKPDLLHQAILLDASPFSFVLLPLQWIPLEAYWAPG